MSGSGIRAHKWLRRLQAEDLGADVIGFAYCAASILVGGQILVHPYIPSRALGVGGLPLSIASSADPKRGLG